MDALFRLRLLIPLFSFLVVLEQLPGGVHFTLVAPYVAALVVVFLLLVMRFAWSLILILWEPKDSPTALTGRRLFSSSGRALVAVLGVVFIAWILPDPTLVKFDRDAWHAQDSTTVTWPSAYSVRERMVDDLVARILPGLTVQEVKAILGPSEAGSGEPPLYYRLCPHPFIDNILLVLSFDGQGRFDKHEFGND